MKAATILTVLWSFCLMIQGIAGNPVRPSDMRQSAGYGPPLTEAELNCIPTYAKSGEELNFKCFWLILSYLLIFVLPCSATYQNYTNEGNDVLPMPFAGKNAYLSLKWPSASIPYEIDSTFGNF